VPTIKEIENKISELNCRDAVCYLNELRDEMGSKVDKLILKYQKKIDAHNKELERLQIMSLYEQAGYDAGARYICGIDEVGRGPLAGPVVAAAVILPKDTIIKGINDSKKLSPQKREALYDEICQKSIAYAIGLVDEKIIDEINILNATKMAMQQAVSKLSQIPDYLLIDSVKLSDINIRQSSFDKGDAKSVSIAAASIIAKVTRDRMMDKFHNDYPAYGFTNHKGYGTAEHIDAIKNYGLCPLHRRSFTKNFTVGTS
jgi:ribonuclease HII